MVSHFVSYLLDSSDPTFVQWQCPICLKNYSLENLMIDPYFNRITSLVGPRHTFFLCLFLDIFMFVDSFFLILDVVAQFQ